MVALKKLKGLLFFHLCVNLFIGVFISFSSYFHLPLFEFKDHFYYAVHFAVLQFSVFGFTYLLSLNKYIFTVVFPVLFFLLSNIAFWGYSQDISLSHGVIQACLETKKDIVFDLISWQLIVYQVSCLVVVSFILYRYWKIKESKFNIFLFLLACAGVLCLTIVENVRPSTFKSRLPYSLYFEACKFYEKPKVVYKSIDKKLSRSENDLKIVFVLGESVRADHIQLNGYSRKTNPLLVKKANLLSFPNAFTTNYYTGASVPQILSNASVYDDYSESKISLIDVLNQSGVYTSWIGNQTPEQSYLPFINQSKNVFFVDPTHSEYSFTKALDEELISKFDGKGFQKNCSEFILLHMMGSHWWYENRYDSRFRKFRPTIKSKYVPSNSPEEMINSYDNTIVYLDYFLDRLINNLEKSNENCLMIYVSDHGELLGENGKWLHAQPDNQKGIKNPAVFIWYSEKFKSKYPEKVKQLLKNDKKELPLDFVYHSMLDVYGIGNIEVKKNMSVFNQFEFKR